MSRSTEPHTRKTRVEGVASFFVKFRLPLAHGVAPWHGRARNSYQENDAVVFSFQVKTKAASSIVSLATKPSRACWTVSELKAMRAIVGLLLVVAIHWHGALGRQMAVVEDAESEMLKVGALHVSEFKWKDCSLPGSPITVHHVEVSPDPIILPGKLHVAASITSRVALNAPIVADTYVWKQSGSRWNKVPCLRNAGTCHYKDVCKVLAKSFASKPCPPVFKQLKQTCHCPIRKGDFQLHQAFPLPKLPWYVPKSIVNGNFHVIANATTSSGENICSEMWLAVHAN